jgi:hypothetical protein
MTGDNIRAIQNLECTDDAEIVLKATALLNSKPEHQKIEV